jgi:hypothetical protein
VQGPTRNLTKEQELMPPPLRDIQYNCTRPYVSTLAVLGIGVEWEADVVCLQVLWRETA